MLRQGSKYWFVAWVCLLPYLGYVQTNYDEFKQKVESAVSKREKAAVYLQMTEDFVEDEPETALQLAQELVKLVEGQKSKQAQAYLLLGQSQYYLNYNKEAVLSFQQALAFAQKHNKNNLNLQANILSFWGSTHLFMGQYSEAIQRSTEGLKIAQRANNPEIEASILSDLSYTNLQLGEFEKSLQQRLAAYQIHKTKNDSSELNVDLNELGMIYRKWNKQEEAIQYLKESNKYLTKNSPIYDYIGLYNNLSNIYLKQFQEDNNKAYLIDSIEFYLDEGLRLVGDEKNIPESIYLFFNYANLEMERAELSLAQQYLNDADSIILQVGDPRSAIQSKSLRAKLEVQSKNWNKALNLCNEILATESIPSDIKLSNLRRKSTILTNLNRNKEAIEVLNAYVEERENFISAQSTRELERFRTVYETDLKEERIARLEQEQVDERKRKQVGFSVLIALLILSIGFMMFLRYTFQQRRQIKALEFERQLNFRDNQIELLQDRVANFVEQPKAKNKPQEVLPELEEINQSLLSHITEREYEVLKSVEQGLSNKEIADAHFISVNTVKFHLRNIYTKLDVSNRIQVIQKLKEFG